MLGERDVVLVHVHGDAEQRADAFRDADVVEVRVREDEGLDVVERATDAAERGVERLPGGGNAGVDERQPVVGLEQVEVRERVLDAVHSRRDFGVQVRDHGQI
jgi:hypothetical protein